MSLPPYLLLRFEYGWAVSPSSDKVYIAAGLWCPERLNSDKLNTIRGPFGRGRFLGLTMFGKRPLIERRLRMAEGVPYLRGAVATPRVDGGQPYYGEMRANVEMATSIINAIDSCPRPTVEWSRGAGDTALDTPPRLYQPWSTVQNILTSKVKKGYRYSGWDAASSYIDSANTTLTRAASVSGHDRHLTVSSDEMQQFYSNLLDPEQNTLQVPAPVPMVESRTLKSHRPTRRRIIEL